MVCAFCYSFGLDVMALIDSIKKHYDVFYQQGGDRSSSKLFLFIQIN